MPEINDGKELSSDSDDEYFDPELPYMDKTPIGKLDVSSLLTGNGSVDFSFEVPPPNGSMGYNMSSQASDSSFNGTQPPDNSKCSRPSPGGTGSIFRKRGLDPGNVYYRPGSQRRRQELETEFGQDDRFNEIEKTMYGDFGDIEPLMKSIPDYPLIKKLLLRPGWGKEVESQSMITLHYKIGAEHMDEIIENSYNRKNSDGTLKGPLKFRCGNGEVLPVMDYGVLTMRVGEIAKFLAPCKYGYGPVGVPLIGDGKAVPAESSVMVQMEILDTWSSTKGMLYEDLTLGELSELPFEDIHDFAEIRKKAGNKVFKTEEYEEAKLLYKEAYEAIRLIDVDILTPEQKDKYFLLRRDVCNNLAQVCFKLEKYKRAFTWAVDGTKNPLSGVKKAKSHFWCAKSLFAMGKYELCLEHIEKASLVRSDVEIKQLKEQAQRELNKASTTEKEMCARMMSVRLAENEENLSGAHVDKS